VDVCTSAPWRKDDLFRAVQIDVKAFNIQQGGYLGQFRQLVAHVVDNREKRSLWLKFVAMAQSLNMIGTRSVMAGVHDIIKNPSVVNSSP